MVRQLKKKYSVSRSSLVVAFLIMIIFGIPFLLFPFACRKPISVPSALEMPTSQPMSVGQTQTNPFVQHSESNILVSPRQVVLNKTEIAYTAPNTNEPCHNRTFCIESIVRNFVISPFSAVSIVFGSNEPLCFCNESVKTSFQLMVKKIMEASPEEYKNETNVDNVLVERFTEIKGLMKSNGIIPDSVNDFEKLPEMRFSNETKILSRNLNCTLVYVKGSPHYKSLPSNVSRTSVSPFLEKGNNLAVCIKETNLTSLLLDMSFNTTFRRGRIELLPKQPLSVCADQIIIRKELNDFLEGTRNATVSVLDATTLDIKSIEAIFQDALNRVGGLMKSREYFDVELGEIEFRNQLIQNPKSVEAYSTGPFKMSLKIEWEDLNTYRLSSQKEPTPQPKLDNQLRTDCLNRTFCIEPIMRNFIIPPFKARHMLLNCSERLCFCNEVEKADFQLAVKQIMENSSDQYDNATNVVEERLAVKGIMEKALDQYNNNATNVVVVERFMKIKGLMKSYGLIPDAINDIKILPNKENKRTEVQSKNPSCKLLHVKGIPYYQTNPSNNNYNDTSLFLERGNNLTVCVVKEKVIGIFYKKLNNPVGGGKIELRVLKSVNGQEFLLCMRDVTSISQMNDLLQKTSAKVNTKISSGAININSLGPILSEALRGIEKILRATGFPLVLGEIKFREQVKNSPKIVEAYSVGPFQLALVFELENNPLSNTVSRKKL